MIVITLSKVPPALRGDLTKWYQEVQTGVYVGNVSARIRDNLWDRILENIGRGEAAMVFNAQNELGYQFRTTRQDHEVVDFDGIPLLMRLTTGPATIKPGFSDAAKFHQAHLHSRSRPAKANKDQVPTFIALDIETTGLNAERDQIISIAAVKSSPSSPELEFYRLITTNQPIPAKISELTQLTTEELSTNGVPLRDALEQLTAFTQKLPIVGYNVRFDDEFLTAALRQNDLPSLSNEFIDLLPIVKRTNAFLNNYKLETTLDHYQIDNPHPHNALFDARATLALASKLIENGKLKIAKAD